MKYYIIAGEASGDLHASNLMKEISANDKEALYRGIGGDKMISQKLDCLLHYKEIAFMGLTDVLLNILTIRKAINNCKADVINFNPDVIILVDYPGFNLKIAEFAKSKYFKVVYYISPKVWAWKSSRAYKIAKHVDKLLTILPFETEFFKKYNIEANYVGNPILDELNTFAFDKDFKSQNNLDDKPIIALLPGSRKQEIEKCLPTMISIINNFPHYQFVIAGMSITKDWINNLVIDKKIKIVYDSTYDLLKNAEAAMVTSGTATLETALLNVPQICCYKTSNITYQVAKRVVNISYISLVNLILNKEAIKELIQDDFNSKKLSEELSYILPKGKKRINQQEDYKYLKSILGNSGASKNAADIIYSFLFHS
jgi:lipid-A-disaccharide synthase